jgi:ComF family protein
MRLKYARRTAFAQTAARAMARLVPDDADLLVPVPLHRWRLWSRGYNQAALIALGLASNDVPAAINVLRRSKATPVLRGLGRRGRAKAVAGAFVLAPSASTRIAGKHIVLVDDVFTTGATANACTRTLLRGGAAKVTVVCWARVIADDPAD